MLPLRKKMEYLEQLTCEIDVPDYERWLARVRQEEAAERAKGFATKPFISVLRPRVSSSAENRWQAYQRRSRTLSALNRGREAPAENTASSSLKAKLFHVCDAWEDVLNDRSRDAIYPYLKAVYRLVRRCERDGHRNDLLRCALKIAGLPDNGKVDLFSTVIRSTCDGKLDPKQVSKFSRALRYAASRERPPRMLIDFIKGMGGINACASRYARKLGRGGRQR